MAVAACRCWFPLAGTLPTSQSDSQPGPIRYPPWSPDRAGSRTPDATVTDLPTGQPDCPLVPRPTCRRLPHRILDGGAADAAAAPGSPGPACAAGAPTARQWRATADAAMAGAALLAAATWLRVLLLDAPAPADGETATQACGLPARALAAPPPRLNTMPRMMVAGNSRHAVVLSRSRAGMRLRSAGRHRFAEAERFALFGMLRLSCTAWGVHTKASDAFARPTRGRNRGASVPVEQRERRSPPRSSLNTQILGLRRGAAGLRSRPLEERAKVSAPRGVRWFCRLKHGRSRGAYMLRAFSRRRARVRAYDSALVSSDATARQLPGGELRSSLRFSRSPPHMRAPARGYLTKRPRPRRGSTRRNEGFDARCDDVRPLKCDTSPFARRRRPLLLQSDASRRTAGGHYQSKELTTSPASLTAASPLGKNGRSQPRHALTGRPSMPQWHAWSSRPGCPSPPPLPALAPSGCGP
eukprot:145342-Chlamydomonas_euryale.AAC.2